MRTILALYRGQSVAEAKIIAVSVDPDLISYVVGQLLTEKNQPEGDPVIEKLDRGRRGALRAIKKEAVGEGRQKDMLRLIQGEVNNENEEEAGRPS